MKKNIWIFNHYATNMYFDNGGRHYWFAKYLKQADYNPVIFCANTLHGFDKIGRASCRERVSFAV